MEYFYNCVEGFFIFFINRRYGHMWSLYRYFQDAFVNVFMNTRSIFPYVVLRADRHFDDRGRVANVNKSNSTFILIYFIKFILSIVIKRNQPYDHKGQSERELFQVQIISEIEKPSLS